MSTLTASQPQACLDIQLLELDIKNRIGYLIQYLNLRWMDRRDIILSGRGKNYDARQTAQEIVMQATDISILANDIQVS